MNRRMAPHGQIFVCQACGKMSRDQYGDQGTLWDASCFLHSILCYVDKLEIKDGRVKKVLEGGLVKGQ